MKIKESIRIIWNNNRWYRNLSILTGALFVSKFILGIVVAATFNIGPQGPNAFLVIYSKISLILLPLEILWLASTATVAYLFLSHESHHEAAKGLSNSIPPHGSVPVSTARTVKSLVLSVFAVIAILALSFVLVILFASTART